MSSPWDDELPLPTSGLSPLEKGALLRHYLSVKGIDLSFVYEKGNLGSFPVAAMLYTQFDPLFVLFSWAFGSVVAVVASIYPAWVASNMAPADAVRAR